MDVTHLMRLLLLLGLALPWVHVSSKEREGADVECKAGPCFYRLRSSIWLHPIETGSTLRLSEGDIALTVGPDARIEVRFEDGSVMRLNKSGVLKIRRGLKHLEVGDAKTSATAGAVASQGPSQSNSDAGLVYVGSVPLRVLAPPLGAPLVMMSFPTELRIVIEAIEDPEAFRSRYAEWTLGDESLKFEETAAGSAQFALTIKVKGPGDIVLKNRFDPSAEGLLIQIRQAQDLEGQLKDLLKNADQNPEGQIELRSP